MPIQKQKVKLSPKLGMGVGRRTGRGKVMPYASIIFLVISGVLAIRAGYMVVNKSAEVSPNEPQILGATDTPSNKTMFRDYKVKKGETVFTIGQQHNIEWTTLATINGLEAPFTLKEGQVLKIPQQ